MKLKDQSSDRLLLPHSASPPPYSTSYPPLCLFPHFSDSVPIRFELTRWFRLIAEDQLVDSTASSMCRPNYNTEHVSTFRHIVIQTVTGQ